MSCKIPTLKIQLPLSIDSLEMRLPCSTDISKKSYFKLIQDFRFESKILKARVCDPSYKFEPYS